MAAANIKTLAHVEVTGAAFNIYISMNMDSGAIHIFKYDNNQCDYGVFMDGDSACDFINLGMPVGRWGYKARDESED
jgi:hypothetical protein